MLSASFRLSTNSYKYPNDTYTKVVINRVKLNVCTPCSFGVKASVRTYRQNRALYAYFFILFAIFILHLRESELYRYIMDGTSALGWELPFAMSAPPVFHIKVEASRFSALPKDTTSNLAGLFSTTSPKYRAPSREGVDTILKLFWYDSTRGLNSRSTGCQADAPTTTPLHRYRLSYTQTFYLVLHALPISYRKVSTK